MTFKQVGQKMSNINELSDQSAHLLSSDVQSSHMCDDALINRAADQKLNINLHLFYSLFVSINDALIQYDRMRLTDWSGVVRFEIINTLQERLSQSIDAVDAAFFAEFQNAEYEAARRNGRELLINIRLECENHNAWFDSINRNGPCDLPAHYAGRMSIFPVRMAISVAELLKFTKLWDSLVRKEILSRIL